MIPWKEAHDAQNVIHRLTLLISDEPHEKRDQMLELSLQELKAKLELHNLEDLVDVLITMWKDPDRKIEALAILRELSAKIARHSERLK